MPKYKKIRSQYKEYSKLLLWFIPFLLFLIVGCMFILRKNQKNNLYISSVLSEFKKMAPNDNADVQEKNDTSVWWISSDSLNIINDNSSGVRLNLNQCETDSETKSIFNQTAVNLAQKINQIMKKNDFTLNIENSSQSIDDSRFYDYVQAYEKNNIKCVFTADPDCGKLIEETKMHYTFSFNCTDKFAENYKAQFPYLTDLKIKDAIIHVDKKSQDFVKLNVNYRRSGYYTIAKSENGKWQELYSGQDNPSCQILEKYKLPKDILFDCYPE